MKELDLSHSKYRSLAFDEQDFSTIKTLKLPNEFKQLEKTPENENFKQLKFWRNNKMPEFVDFGGTKNISINEKNMNIDLSQTSAITVSDQESKKALAKEFGGKISSSSVERVRNLKRRNNNKLQSEGQQNSGKIKELRGLGSSTHTQAPHSPQPLKKVDIRTLKYVKEQHIGTK